MKNTNPIFSLKNFRSFGEENADFELAPITVLTGCNSAGKSSLVKALMLLSRQPITSGKTYLSSKFTEEDETLDFDRIDAGADVVRNNPTKQLKVSAKEFGLGRFDKVLHRFAQEEVIVISYKIWSRFLQEILIVRKVFKANNSILNDGELVELSIEKKDGTILYKYFFNNKQNDFYDPEMGYVQYTIGWDEMFNINAVLDECNRCIDAWKYRELNDYHEHLNNVLSLRRKTVPDQKNTRIEETIERCRKRMNEIKSQYGNIMDDFLLSDDWKATYPESIRLSKTPMEELRLSKLNEEEKHEEEHLRNQNNVFNNVINDCLNPWFLNDITYIDSSSATVKRLYSVEDENKMCVALGKLIKQGRTGSYVNKWLKMFGIADSIEVVGTNEGIGIMVYLIRGDEKYLLADEGYGITQLVSLFLQIQNTIIDNKRTRTKPFEDNDEYYYRHSFIAIEEPEVHLHPKYQSLLADMFVEAYQKYNIHFIIETHSEYLIRKLQVLVADKENKLTPNDVSLNYVDKDENGVSHNRQIKIQEDGRLSEPFGPGFFDEADGLAMELMRYKVRR